MLESDVAIQKTVEPKGKRPMLIVEKLRQKRSGVGTFWRQSARRTTNYRMRRWLAPVKVYGVTIAKRIGLPDVMLTSKRFATMEHYSATLMPVSPSRLLSSRCGIFGEKALKGGAFHMDVMRPPGVYTVRMRQVNAYVATDEELGERVIRTSKGVG